MDAFSSIPNHTGFTARNLFMDRQGILRGGAFAKIAPGGGPLSPHRHAHAHLFIVTRGTISVMLDGEERTVHEYESQLVPGGVLHAVWNRNTEPAEFLPHIVNLMSSRQRTLGHAAALMTILIWGTTFVSTKVLLRDFTPVTVLFTRFVIGYAFLWCLKPRFLPFSGWKKEFLFAGAGLTGVTLYFLLENIALTYTFASNVGIIVAVVPFFTALLAHFLLKGEGFSRRFFLGFAAAFTGIFLIMANGAFVLELNPAGDILALGAAFVWAAYSILMKKIGVNTSNMIICTRRIFFYGIALMIPALWLLPANMDWHLMVKPVNAFNLLYLGLFASALCFLTWNRVVEILGAVKSSIYIYMVPVVAVVASAIILGERLTWISLTGILLTLCGVTISEYRKKTRKSGKKRPS